MRKTRIIFTIILFIVLLSGCEADDSNKKKDKAESKDIRIVPTTVALTMTLDKLDLPIVGKPTSYKKLPDRYKNVPEVGQPMEPSVEAVKKVNPTHVLSVSTIKDEMKPFYKQLNMKGYFYDYDSLDGMEKSITELGKQLQKDGKANERQKVIEEVLGKGRKVKDLDESQAEIASVLVDKLKEIA